MSKIKLRRATLADVDEATVCISAAYAPALREIPDLPDVAGGVAQDIATHEAVVVEDGTGIIGYVVYGVVEDAMMVFNLAVSPAAQGKGVAKRLLEHVEGTARTQGVERLRLRTHRLMQRTVAMYQYLGWGITSSKGNSLVMEKPVR